jgi:hypothetical protein
MVKTVVTGLGEAEFDQAHTYSRSLEELRHLQLPRMFKSSMRRLRLPQDPGAQAPPKPPPALALSPRIRRSRVTNHACDPVRQRVPQPRPPSRIGASGTKSLPYFRPLRSCSRAIGMCCSTGKASKSVTSQKPSQCPSASSPRMWRAVGIARPQGGRLRLWRKPSLRSEPAN